MRIEPECETSRTRALTTTPQKRRRQEIKVPYLTQINEKKAIDRKFIATLC